MTSHGEAETYLAELNQSVRTIATGVHASFVTYGCLTYVKTIYVGYELDGEMVAALYGHADHVEVALALPEDATGPLLVDASHLTWRTLPVAAILRDPADVQAFVGLAEQACERVRTREHAVLRDNEFFIRSHTRPWRRGGLPSK